MKTQIQHILLRKKLYPLRRKASFFMLIFMVITVHGKLLMPVPSQVDTRENLWGENIPAPRKSTDSLEARPAADNSETVSEASSPIQGKIFIAANTTVKGWEYIKNYTLISGESLTKKPLRKIISAPKHKTVNRSHNKQQAENLVLYTYNTAGEDFFRLFTASKPSACIPSLPLCKYAAVRNDVFTLVPHSTHIPLCFQDIHFLIISGVWRTGPSRGPPAFYL